MYPSIDEDFAKELKKTSLKAFTTLEESRKNIYDACVLASDKWKAERLLTQHLQYNNTNNTTTNSNNDNNYGKSGKSMRLFERRQEPRNISELSNDIYDSRRSSDTYGHGYDSHRTSMTDSGVCVCGAAAAHSEHELLSLGGSNVNSMINYDVNHMELLKEQEDNGYPCGYGSDRHEMALTTESQEENDTLFGTTTRTVATTARIGAADEFGGSEDIATVVTSPDDEEITYDDYCQRYKRLIDDNNNNNNNDDMKIGRFFNEMGATKSTKIDYSSKDENSENSDDKDISPLSDNNDEICIRDGYGHMRRRESVILFDGTGSKQILIGRGGNTHDDNNNNNTNNNSNNNINNNNNNNKEGRRRSSNTSIQSSSSIGSILSCYNDYDARKKYQNEVTKISREYENQIQLLENKLELMTDECNKYQTLYNLSQRELKSLKQDIEINDELLQDFEEFKMAAKAKIENLEKENLDLKEENCKLLFVEFFECDNFDCGSNLQERKKVAAMIENMVKNGQDWWNNYKDPKACTKPLSSPSIATGNKKASRKAKKSDDNKHNNSDKPNNDSNKNNKEQDSDKNVKSNNDNTNNSNKNGANDDIINEYGKDGKDGQDGVSIARGARVDGDECVSGRIIIIANDCLHDSPTPPTPPLPPIGIGRGRSRNRSVTFSDTTKCSDREGGEIGSKLLVTSPSPPCHKTNDDKINIISNNNDNNNNNNNDNNDNHTRQESGFSNASNSSSNNSGSCSDSGSCSNSSSDDNDDDNDDVDSVVSRIVSCNKVGGGGSRHSGSPPPSKDKDSDSDDWGDDASTNNVSPKKQNGWNSNGHSKFGNLRQISLGNLSEMSNDTVLSTKVNDGGAMFNNNNNNKDGANAYDSDADSRGDLLVDSPIGHGNDDTEIGNSLKNGLDFDAIDSINNSINNNMNENDNDDNEDRESVASEESEFDNSEIEKLQERMTVAKGQKSRDSMVFDGHNMISPVRRMVRSRGDYDSYDCEASNKNENENSNKNEENERINENENKNECENDCENDINDKNDERTVSGVNGTNWNDNESEANDYDSDAECESEIEDNDVAVNDDPMKNLDQNNDTTSKNIDVGGIQNDCKKFKNNEHKRSKSN